MNKLKKPQFIPLNDDDFKDYIAQNINVNENLTRPQKDIIVDTLPTSSLFKQKLPIIGL